ncbi:winged helix-turn-helix domain-containing protein [Paenibacillus sp. YYML68]|uniref:winged helix-turn-helix domain-containing protein n=1 Tax=Paenibacillus sp. YYML68 TaxID=2909250 RepID=UPI00249022CB|nr:winged helix-turn-helix domain-containing protein [Paenibacillus sp. YYML68]
MQSSRKVIELASVRLMPKTPREEQAARELPEPTGAYCSKTQRLAVISVFPERLHELVGDLSARCLDVMMFHRFEPDVMRGLPVEAIVLDAAAAEAAGELAALREAVAQHSGSRAQLVWLVDREGLAAQLPAHSLVVSTRDRMLAVERIMGRLSAAESMGLSGDAATDASVRVQHSGGTSGVYTFKDLTLDPKRMTLSQSGKRVDVTKTEFELLLLLMQAGGEVLSREVIMDGVWGSQYFGGSNVVDVHVKSLRKKLRDSAAAPAYISTVRGVGYRLADGQ